VKPLVRRRFWLESGSAIASGGLLLLTLIWHDWIELVLGVDPDHGSGSLEGVIVAIAGVLAVTLAITARFELRRGTAVAAAGEAGC
jgi:hypothetical protein